MLAARGAMPMSEPKRLGAGRTVDARELGPSLEDTGTQLRVPLGTEQDQPTNPGLVGDDTPPRAMRIERAGAPTLTVPLYTDRTYVFGRGPECTFVFASDAVSRLHGQLMFDPSNRWAYRD